MATEKVFSRVKVVVDDKYERFVENSPLKGVTMQYNGDERRFDILIPKEQKRSNEAPDKMVEGKDTDMYFSRKRCGGYNFHLQVNVPLFKKMGEDGLVDEFRTCVHDFLKKIA